MYYLHNGDAAADNRFKNMRGGTNFQNLLCIDAQ